MHAGDCFFDFLRGCLFSLLVLVHLCPLAEMLSLELLVFLHLKIRDLNLNIHASNLTVFKAVCFVKSVNPGRIPISETRQSAQLAE